MISRKETGGHLGRGGNFAGDRCLQQRRQDPAANRVGDLAGHPRGSRRTDIETILDQAYLLNRLDELVPVLITGDLLPATTAAAE